MKNLSVEALTGLPFIAATVDCNYLARWIVVTCCCVPAWVVGILLLPSCAVGSLLLPHGLSVATTVDYLPSWTTATTTVTAVYVVEPNRAWVLVKNPSKML